MKRITLSAFVVLALISVDATISMAYAKSKITIYKVTKVTTKNKLRLRAWPSAKSRVKVSIPHNAIDLTETGKQKILGNAKWLEVNWQNNKGWVNARYLKKTGVLLRPSVQADTRVATKSSRNVTQDKKSTAKINTNVIPRTVAKKARVINNRSTNAMPQMPTENRYSQPVQIAASGMKMAYAEKKQSRNGKMLRCIGSSPQPWSIKMDVANSNMDIKIKNGRTFNLPINYHEWATPNKIRMNIGGNKGRNIVDVNLEKTDACSTGLSRTNYMYEVNATINREFFSGCCETIAQ